MKKFTLLIALFLFGFVSVQAQFNVTTDGQTIEEGQVFKYGSTEFSEAYLEYEIHNTSDEPIDVRIKVVSMENTDGSGMELCLGNCYYSVTEGQTYPIESYVTIQPGETQPTTGDHFLNSDEGNGEEVITYVFEFQQLDVSGNFPTETLNMVYQYDPDYLSVNGQNKAFEATIVNTMINNGELNVKTQKPVDMQIYNLLGKQVKTAKLDNGLNTVNVSNLSSQVYLVRFQNAHGQTKTQKVVIE